jgi:selenide, water dikinase
MAPGDLQEVLAGLRRPAGVSAETERNLLVGLGSADDAAVYRLAGDLAIVETVDFFPPVVDDPWTWGAIAAVNAMSDVYAMGGEVLFALAIAGFPRDFDKKVIAEVFRGGAEKVAEAGGVIAGGHTVVDPEPKYGLCVTGRVHPDRVFIKGGLRAGDRLFLSKPLGTGVITTAAKNDHAPVDVLEAAIAGMLRLNRVAARVAGQLGAVGVTDITGFGLLGHAAEMVDASGAGIALEAGRLPLLPGALALAEAGHFSGGMKRNRRHLDAAFGGRLQIDPRVPAPLAGLLSEAETSGGLLFSIARERADGVLDAFAEAGERCWDIGEVLSEPLIRVGV